MRTLQVRISADIRTAAAKLRELADRMDRDRVARGDVRAFSLWDDSMWISGSPPVQIGRAEWQEDCHWSDEK